MFERGTSVVLLAATIILVASAQEDINCDFENGFCRWNQVESDQGDMTRLRGWSRVSTEAPITDHTTETPAGHYLYIGSNDDAQIKSPAISVEKESCLGFFYFMESGSRNKIIVYTVTDDKQLSIPFWTESLCPRSTWTEALVKIPPGKSVEIVIEARFKISIDDIAFFPDTQCSKELFAKKAAVSIDWDFDDGTLGSWRQDSTDDFDWSLISGDSKTIGTVRIGDHSTSDGSGKYIYIETDGTISGAKARIVSQAVTGGGPRCLKFWYHMSKKNFGTLKVYAKTGASLSRPLWSKTQLKEKEWLYAEVDIDKSQDFNVVFECVKGEQGEGDIALDDISMEEGPCKDEPSQMPFTCDFESGQCGFSQDRKNDYDWSFHQGSSKTSWTGPIVDHTLGTTLGHYYYAEASGNEKREGEKALLVSPVFAAASTEVCLEFYYHMYGSTMGALNVKSRSNDIAEATLWTIEGDLGDQWNKATVTLHAPLVKNEFQFLFEAIRGSYFYSDVAIDDVTLRTGSCNNPATCNFDQGICSFTQSQNDDFDWTRNSGSTDSQMTGPSDDHTHGNSDGSYMYLESSSPRVLGERAVLESESLPATDGSCLTFWYHMAGAGIGTLNIKLGSSPVRTQVIWSLSGPRRNVWLFGQVPVQYPKSDFFLYMEGIRGQNYTGDIAIDDIVFHNVECKTQPPEAGLGLEPVVDVDPMSTEESYCSFNKDFCTWKQESEDKFDWEIQATAKAPGPVKDHIGDGSFAVIDTTSPREAGDNAILTSPDLTGRRCLSFWYYMWGEHVATLKVNIGKTEKWIRSETQRNQWYQAKINFKKESPYKVSIEAVVSKTSEGGIAIDDISAKSEKCPETGIHGPSCDFETNMCDYFSYYDGGFYWTRNKADAPLVNEGPATDHTYGTSQGHYACVKKGDGHSQSPANIGLTIKDVESDISGFCLEFWYHMNGQAGDALFTSVQNSGKMFHIWRRQGNLGNTWHHASARIPHFNEKEFELFFHAEVASTENTDIAIDDVLLRKGSCYGDAEIGDCDFGIDLCTWTENESGNMNWLLGQGPTQSRGTGPSADHTRGLSRNGYIYIETSSPIPVAASAVLMSQLFSSQDASCFHFYYNMYGASIGSLRIWLATYDASADSSSMLDKTLLWELIGNQGQGWNEGKVAQPAQTQHFRILIEGIKGLSDTGDIALDDFFFTTGDVESCQTTPSDAVPQAAPEATS